MAAEATPEKRTALEWVDTNAAGLSEDHMSIWHLHVP